MPSNEPLRVRGAAVPHRQGARDGPYHEGEISKKVLRQTREEQRRCDVDDGAEDDVTS